MIVHKVEPAEWREVSEVSHAAVFNEIKPKEWDRIDYALVVNDGDNKAVGYVTCRELDSQTVYWQFGGCFLEYRNSIKTFRAYQAFVRWAKDSYSRVCTYIENTNEAMLKMAAKVGFVIVGVRNFNGSVLLEHLLEFKEIK